MAVTLNRENYVAGGIILFLLLSFVGYIIFDRSSDNPGSQQAGIGTQTEEQSTLQEESADVSLGTTVGSPNITADSPETADIIQKLARHIKLPLGDVEVAEVVDPDASRAQSPIFYQYAEKGDKVLIYADRAILYNPMTDKIVDILHIPNSQ